MAKIISVHSFRGGTGKSNATANIAALLAQQGHRVGVIDTDVQSPGIHVLFGVNGKSIQYALNDYLYGRVAIEQVAMPVLESEVKGRLYLIPSSMNAEAIVQVLRQGYEMKLLTAAFRELNAALNLDYLLIDTHPGLNEETLFSLAISRVVLIVMRPDTQDYEGTGVAIEVARTLDVPRMVILVNKTPPDLAPEVVKGRVESAFNCPVAAVLPHSNEMMSLASAGIFALRYPQHPLSETLRQLTAQVAL